MLALALASPFLLSILPAASQTPPALGILASINDPLSHGQVGDGLLSLNEAIQLHNGTLPLGQLSAAEVGQLSLATGVQRNEARLDATATPTITIQQDLDAIIGTSHGLLLSSVGGSTTLDFNSYGLAHGLRATTDALEVHNLTFSGGRYGIDAMQTDTSGRVGLEVIDCRFASPYLFGVRVQSTTTNGTGRVLLEGCAIDNTATGFIWDGSRSGRTSFVTIRDCELTNILAHGMNLAAGFGGMAHYTLKRIVIRTAPFGYRGIVVRHSGDRTVNLSMLHVDCDNMLEYGLLSWAAASSVWQIRMTRLTTLYGVNAGNSAISGLVEDSIFDSSIILTTGGPMTFRNVRVQGGAMLTTPPGQALTVIDSRFDNGPVNVGGGTFQFDNCCFVNAPLAAPANGSATCIDSFVPNPGPGVTVTNPRPQPQLGGMQVLPDQPTTGSTVTLRADLPPGLLGVFLLGLTDPNPVLLPQPLHIYGSTGATWIVPTIVRFQQSVPWAIPNNPAFRGMDLVGQIAVVPNAGVNAPPLQLPPGRRFVLQ